MYMYLFIFLYTINIQMTFQSGTNLDIRHKANLLSMPRNQNL